MSRRLSALFLLVAILSASAGMLLFATLRLQFHHHRMAYVHPVGPVEMEVNPASHPELLNGVRELRLNGSWFDVETVRSRDGKLIVTGHFDDEEEALLIRIGRFSKDIGARGREWAPVVTPPVYFESLEITRWSQPYAVELTFPESANDLPDPVLSPLVPPPLERA